MLKANFRNILESFAQGDPKLAFEDEKVKLTPAQAAMKGITEGFEGANQGQGALGEDDKYVVPAGEPTTMLAGGSGRPSLSVGEPNSTLQTPEEEGYADIPVTGSPPPPATRAAGQPVMPASRPAPMNLDESLAQKKQALLDATNTPVDKTTSKWKDVLAYIVQGANAAFNPNPNNKIEGYGKIKHDIAVRKAQGELDPLMRQKAGELEIQDKQEQVNTERRRQEDLVNQGKNRNAKTLLDIAENERKKTEAEAKAGNWEPRVENGVIFKHFPDGREEPLMRDGKQVVDKIKTPVQTIVDGKEVWVLGNQVIDLAVAKEMRQAQMNFEADKYNAEEANDYSERLEKWAIEESKRTQDTLQWQNDANTKIAEAETLERQAQEAEARATELKNGGYNDADARKDAASARAKAVVARKEGEAFRNKALNSRSLPKPSKPKVTLTAPKLGGKPVPKSKDPYGLYQ